MWYYLLTNDLKNVIYGMVIYLGKTEIHIDFFGERKIRIVERKE